MDYPRVLVISNNSFSKTSSNGRTLSNLFRGWPKENLAQFCISTTEPDYEICENYYLMTDKSALEAFIRFGKGQRCNIQTNKGSEGNTVIGGRKVYKTPWKALLRHIIWSGKRWNSREFQEWVNDFNPKVVVVMNSDADFILDIATYVSKTRKVPLVMYNTEGFYFLTKMYNRSAGWYDDLSLKIYQSLYRKHFRRMMKQVAMSIHLNSLLQEDFSNVFGGKHTVIYSSSEMRFDSSNLHLDAPTFSYLGNFGYDRPDALIEIAEVLQSINPAYKLDVYGKIPREEIEKRFEKCPGLNYKGMVSYDEVTKVMYGSTILFHAEGQSKMFKEALRWGFSTKIADSVSCGHPFLMYSSPNIAGAKYIIDTGAGWFAQNKEDLKDAIISILTEEEKRNAILSIAKKTAEQNHRVEKNREVFLNALDDII